MAKLSDLQNIGKVLEARLVEAGVDTPETLRELGSREALVRLREADPGACVRELYALEGAIRGVKDTALPEEVKAELRAFHKSRGRAGE